MVSQFVHSGLHAGDRIWCFANSRRHEVLGWLQCDDAVASGQLTVLPTHKSVLSVLGSDPSGVIDGLRRAVDAALDEGWNGFRMVGDLGWATRGRVCARQLLDFERRVGEVLAGSPAATLCQYDRYRFDTDTMVTLTEAHGAMVGTVTAPPDEGLSCTPLTQPSAGLRLAGEVDLATHERLRTELRAAIDGPGDLHLELSELTFVDNGGAQILIQAAEQLGPERRLVLHHPPRSLTITLTMLGSLAQIVIADELS